jgi:hypothetical protein
MITATNNLTITGRITEIGAQVQGENWQKQDFTIETTEQYSKLVNIHVWNDKIEMLNRCRVGDVVICRINITSKKHENRYYTEVVAWKVEVNLYRKPTQELAHEFKIESDLTNESNWFNGKYTQPPF